MKDQITWTTCQQHADEAIAPWLWALQTDRVVGMWLLASKSNADVRIAIDAGLVNAAGGVEKWCGKE